MEESKIKTPQEITHEAFKYYLDKNNVLVNKAFADGAIWMQDELQSHITKLEARNNDLLILLEKVKELYVVRNRAGSYQEFYTVREQLEQALNKK